MSATPILWTVFRKKVDLTGAFDDSVTAEDRIGELYASAQLNNGQVTMTVPVGDAPKIGDILVPSEPFDPVGE